MCEWQEISLGDLIDVKHGFAFKGDFFQTEPNNIILTTPGNFKIGGGWKEDKCKYYNGDIPEDYILKGGELVVTMTDLSKEVDTLGYSAIIPKKTEKTYLHNQRIGLVEFINDEIDKNYLYWLMRDKEYRWHVVSSASGSTVSHTSPTRIKEYEFLLPSLPEQKAIASVLTSLDEKIDLLHRQNKTLEAMAETLFRQWFVEEAQEEYSELEKYVLVVDNRGKTPPNQKEHTQYPVIEVNALGGKDRLVDYSVIRKYVDEETYITWFRGKPNKYDTLISTVGSIGALSMFIVEEGNIAQNVIAIHATRISPFYLYQVMKFKTDEILQLDIGGVQPSIKVPHLLSMIIPIPSKEKQVTFDNQVIEFVNKMECNYSQIRTLEKLRDTLLPKLMSGEVYVEMEMCNV